MPAREAIAAVDGTAAHEVDAGAALAAVRCDACGLTVFPAHDLCPRCASTDIRSVQLASTGTIEALTSTPAGRVAEVRLDDGVLVLGALFGSGRLRIGDRVRHVPDAAVVRFAADA